MKTQLLLIAACICLLLTGCEHDNYDAPGATLSGKVVYNGAPVGVRTNGTQLELWQDGYQLFTKIPVHIAHDGSYSASLFDGRYKLVRLAGAPWEAQSLDTLIVDVRGNTVFDVPVTPYFVVRGESFRKGTGTVTARFIVDKVVQSADVHSVNLYIGKNILTDHNQSEKTEGLDLLGFTPGSEMSITADLPESLQGLDYVFVRVGVRSTQSNEYYYTQVQKLDLK